MRKYLMMMKTMRLSLTLMRNAQGLPEGGVRGVDMDVVAVAEALRRKNPHAGLHVGLAEEESADVEGVRAARLPQ